MGHCGRGWIRIQFVGASTNFNIKSSIEKPLVFGATGADTFTGHLLQAFPHLSEAFFATTSGAA